MPILARRDGGTPLEALTPPPNSWSGWRRGSPSTPERDEKIRYGTREESLAPASVVPRRPEEPELRAELLAAARKRGILTGADHRVQEGVAAARRRCFSATKERSLPAR